MFCMRTIILSRTSICGFVKQISDWVSIDVAQKCDLATPFRE